MDTSTSEHSAVRHLSMEVCLPGLTAHNRHRLRQYPSDGAKRVGLVLTYSVRPCRIDNRE